VRFEPLAVAGAFAIDLEPNEDERGSFARLWCREDFARRGIVIDIAQANLSTNRQAGTLRGLHLARPPAREGKLVRCQRGRAHDVIVDLRPDSPSRLRHVAIELDARRHNAVWVPPGVAHGFQTLEDDTEIVYLMSEAYRSELATGVRFDDPAFGIAWPLPVTRISSRDREAPDLGSHPDFAALAPAAACPPGGRR
jgi:dTDP-4-dehydrorhamnose 3,5-epimerase